MPGLPETPAISQVRLGGPLNFPRPKLGTRVERPMSAFTCHLGVFSRT